MTKLLCLIGVFTASTAMARGVCEADMARFCLGVLQLGHAELNQCLVDHKDELTEESCRKSLPKNLKPSPKAAAVPAADAEESHGKAPAAHH